MVWQWVHISSAIHLNKRQQRVRICSYYLKCPSGRQSNTSETHVPIAKIYCQPVFYDDCCYHNMQPTSAVDICQNSWAKIRLGKIFLVTKKLMLHWFAIKVHTVIWNSIKESHFIKQKSFVFDIEKNVGNLLPHQKKV